MKIFVLILLLSLKVEAFVENTSKGYANCMSCHISPNGGGILTDYGRSLSSELVSRWKVSKDFKNPFYGALKNKKNLKFGGQYRIIQTYLENDQLKAKQKFVMQNNLEFAFKYLKAFWVGSFGRKEGPKGLSDKGEFLSERHYALWEVSDSVRLRVGKFRQHFGINHSNHTRFVKSALGFGSQTEAYNFEFFKFYEWGELNTSVSLGRFFQRLDNDDLKRNFVFNYTHYLKGKSRLGVSFLVGRDSVSKKNLYGFNFVHSVAKNWTLRSEIDLEQRKTILNDRYGENLDGLYGEHQLGYQLFKGGLAYFVFEHAQRDLSKSKTQIKSHGLGLQLLVIPHVELQIEYQIRNYRADSNNSEHRSFITLHLYH